MNWRSDFSPSAGVVGKGWRALRLRRSLPGDARGWPARMRSLPGRRRFFSCLAVGTGRRTSLRNCSSPTVRCARTPRSLYRKLGISSREELILLVDSGGGRRWRGEKCPKLAGTKQRKKEPRMESLYRKYRPQTSADMVGEQHIVSTLRNALTEGRVAHAYLFPRAARHGQDHHGARSGEGAATARATAPARLPSIPTVPAGGLPRHRRRERTQTSTSSTPRARAPAWTACVRRSSTAWPLPRARGRYKVYIIDEVHMLSVAAFNALLKDAGGAPLARHLRAVHHRPAEGARDHPLALPASGVPPHLDRRHRAAPDLRVPSSEGSEATMSRRSRSSPSARRGGLRDALSMLEQLSVFGDGAVRLDDAQSVLGEVSSDTLARIGGAGSPTVTSPAALPRWPTSPSAASASPSTRATSPRTYAISTWPRSPGGRMACSPAAPIPRPLLRLRSV